MPEGEPPKSPWAWVYKAATALLTVALVAGKLWVSNNFVAREEWEKGQQRTEDRQAIVIKQQQDILIGVNTITTRMENESRREKEVEDLRRKLDELQTYVYQHPTH